MTLKTYKKRFKLPFEYLKYVADPKILIGVNGKLYHLTINKIGLPVANMVIPHDEGTIKIDYKKEIINFT